MGKQTYICECGASFESANKFNNHKSNCKVHYLTKYGNLDVFNQKYLKAKSKTSKILKDRAYSHKQELEQVWIQEKHTCEACGKVMVRKFGSGRFCSRSCANKREHSQESKQALSLKIQKRIHGSDIASNQCIICGRELPFQYRRRKTCSAECLKLYKHNITLSNQRSVGNLKGGFRQGSAKNYKYGTYKGTACDSSYELAYVVYCMDHQIDIKRNFQGFTYLINGKEHLYYPDFLCGDTYVEIKNQETDVVLAKIKQFPKNLSYHILYKDDMKPYIQYCEDTYGKNFCSVLYDKSYPSFLDKTKIS